MWQYLAHRDGHAVGHGQDDEDGACVVDLVFGAGWALAAADDDDDDDDDERARSVRGEEEQESSAGGEKGEQDLAVGSSQVVLVQGAEGGAHETGRGRGSAGSGGLSRVAAELVLDVAECLEVRVQRLRVLHLLPAERVLRLEVSSPALALPAWCSLPCGACCSEALVWAHAGR